LLKYKDFCLLSGFDTNVYLVWDDVSLEAALVDPAEPSTKILHFITFNKLKLSFIINTHGHGDHIGGNAFFREKTGARICINSEDAAMLSDSHLNLSVFFEAGVSETKPDIFLKDGDDIKLGNIELKVIQTPGHTRGSISLYINPFLFSGDTLFYHDIGRTDLPGGREEMILASIRNKLLLLPGDTIVLPGHGPSSTIADEKINNPYI
jgi:hydroxyacylglutathione hydrolase